jgi:glycosyltransferase involved in cell wall biosynthesis
MALVEGPRVMTPLVSVVIPVYKEVENVPRLHEELARMAEAHPAWRWEFVFIDDGSPDGTWEALMAVHRRDPQRVRAIRLKRNFGQTPAMACGVDQARGTLLVTMDGDLQNDPADIPMLLGKIEEGFDVVCGWRHQRQDKLLSRKLPSQVANRLIGGLTGVPLHDYGCSLKAYRAEVIKRTPLYAELHRFITAMVTLTGAHVTEVKVHHRPRRFGRTKYNLGRAWRVAFDMLTVSLLLKFAARPLQFFGLLAGACALVAAVCVWRTWDTYVGASHRIPQILPAAAILSAWAGAHFMALGWMAELFTATAHHRAEPLVAALTET